MKVLSAMFNSLLITKSYPYSWHRNKFGEPKQRRRFEQFRNTLDNFKSEQFVWRTCFSKLNLHAKFLLHGIPCRTIEFCLRKPSWGEGNNLKRTCWTSKTGGTIWWDHHGCIKKGPNLRIHGLINLTRIFSTGSLGIWEKTQALSMVSKVYHCQCSLFWDESPNWLGWSLNHP